MAFKETSGISDFAQVACVDVAPDVPPPDPVVPPPPEDGSPTEKAREATVEQTGADPPPRRRQNRACCPATPRSVAPATFLPFPDSPSPVLSRPDGLGEVR